MYLVHKVLAKKNITIKATITATSGDNIKEDSDEIILTAGQYNYFEYYLGKDYPKDFDLDAQIEAEADTSYLGDRNAVEVVKYNKCDDYLYITVKQVSERLGSSAKYKILYYKNNQIVDTDYSYFSNSASGLRGKGSTDVEDVWIYGIDFDRFEFIFEPTSYYYSSGKLPPLIDYYHNEYYDVVETSIYTKWGYTRVVNKVLAKKDVTISNTVIAFDNNGNVIGKEDDQINLISGQYNYFMYSFDSSINENTTLNMRTYVVDNPFLVGERNGVIMTDSYKDGYYLYISFEQVVEELGTFAEFKILFYKNDKIVDVDDGYFSVYADNLTGKGTTDTVKISVLTIDFDRFEYIYEP